jgi:hypothetical protein
MRRAFEFHPEDTAASSIKPESLDIPLEVNGHGLLYTVQHDNTS